MFSWLAPQGPDPLAALSAYPDVYFRGPALWENAGQLHLSIPMSPFYHTDWLKEVLGESRVSV